MPELVQGRLLEPQVPAAWTTLLRILAEIERVAFDETARFQDRQKMFAGLRERLLVETDILQGTLPAESMAAKTIEERFAQAVLMWTMYASSGAVIVHATLESQTLPHFQPDLPDDPGAHAVVIEALCQAFCIERPQIAGWQNELRKRASNLELKKAIVREIIDSMGVDDGIPQAAVHSLFCSIYGPWPFRPEDLGLFVAEAALVFVAPYREGALTVPLYADRPHTERVLLESFLKHHETGASQTDRFPGFGSLDRSALDERFLSNLHARLLRQARFETLRLESLRETLHTMVTLLPRDGVESYLIHDLWGHTWQETLADFEWDYYRLERVVSEPIDLETGSRDTQRRKQFAGLGDAFLVEDGTVVLDRAAAIAALRREVESRVQLSLNAVVAEALADITEYKYARENPAQDATLPSSSLLSAPVKHDLMVRDITFHFQRWRRSFREFIDDASIRARFSGALAASLGCHAGVPESVQDLSDLVRHELEDAALTSKRSFEAQDDRLPIDIVQRTQAAFARLDRDLTDFIDAGAQEFERLRRLTPDVERWRCPNACLDLLVIALGCFYEHDRETLFWHLDELLRDHFPELFRRLGEALNAPALTQSGRP